MLKKEVKKLLVILISSVLFGILLFYLVLADGYLWIGNDINYSAVENILYHHNLSNNITGTGENRVFSINYTIPGTDILWNGNVVQLSQISGWIFISDATDGDLVINATRNNQTGMFRLPLTVAWGGTSATTSSFYFNVTSINDAPVFSNLENRTFDMSELFEYVIYASDEEDNWPFFFNVTFLNCSTAQWSTRNSTNCTLFTPSQYITNGTAVNISFTPTRNDVGSYIINFSVIDAGTPNATKNQIVNFTVNNVNSAPYFTYLCNNERTTTEDAEFICRINATDIDEINNLTFTANYSWFKFNISNNNSVTVPTNISTGYNASVMVNFTARDAQVGNWSVNLSIMDTNSPQRVNSSIFWFYISNLNDSVVLDRIENITAYTTNTYTIYVNASDNDLLIPDKRVYDENLTFSSNVSWVSITPYQLVSGTNVTTARIYFNPNDAGSSGNFSVNISVRDANNYSSDSRVFIISIYTNHAPVWNTSLITNYTLNESVAFYLNLSTNVSDAELDHINFSYINDTSFPSFSLNRTTGVINFTAYDADVGQHIVTINASDQATASSITFNFTILNINDAPYIEIPLQGNNITVNVTNSNMNATEDTPVEILMYVQDEDFKIPDGQKRFYNESLNISVGILGLNNSLLTFRRISGFPSSQFPNETRYHATFTPRKSDVGAYNITINVTDSSGNLTNIVFNLTINSINHAPALMNFTNQTSKVNANFYYGINATDVEDGISAASGNKNFTFSYLLISGISIFNSTTFNSTTGQINITFNSTNAGSYRIRINATDSTGLNDSKDLWLYVYNSPAINYPASSYQFNNLAENSMSNLTFTVNHSVADNLTYSFYVNNNLTYNLSYYGNNTNLTWRFTPNFTEETYGAKNLTLIALSSLYPELNSTRTWNITINHTNSPVNFTGHINDLTAAYSDTIQIILPDYFSDIDNADTHYNQIVNFTVISNSSPSVITPTLSSWTLTLSSASTTTELLSIRADDLNDSGNRMTNATSNTFQVKFTTPPTSTSTSGGGGSTKLQNYAIKILIPGDIVISDQNYIDVPFAVKNTGNVDLTGVSLSSFVSLNNIYVENVNISIAGAYIDSLKVGQSQNLAMRIYVDTHITGRYKATILANVTSPKFSDWGDFFIELRKINETEAEQMIIFTQKFISENPQCLELTELIREAQRLFADGQFENSVMKAREIVDACKKAISSNEQIWYRDFVQRNFFYIASVVIFVMIFGIILYIYKRVKFNKVKEDNSL